MKTAYPQWLQRLHEWRVQNVSDKTFLLVLAFVVGVLSAVAAFVLHGLINTIVALLTGRFHADTYNWLYLVYPVVGIWLTSLFVRYVVRDNISHGITRILYAISSNRSRLKGHNTWSSVIASAITIGFGGSVGAEAPIVLTGSAIGSNLGQLFRLDNKTLMTLVGCGAAGAIAGIFKAPIAGLVFTLEVLMIDMTMSALLPILVSCVTATCFTYLFSGNAVLFSFHLDSDWTVERVPACILLGITCGLISLYFIRTMTFCENLFARFKNKPYVKLLIGGIILSTLIFLFPSLYGEGYHSINLLLNGKTEADWNQILDGSLFYGHSEYIILYLALVLFTKVFATSARLWRYLRTLAVHRLLYGFPVLATVEHESDRCLCAREKLCPAGYGRCNVGRYARSADGHLPHCRDNQRLQPLHAINDSFCGCLSDHQHL